MGQCANASGKACLVGWDWDERPQWAEKLGIKGVDTDTAFLADVGVESRSGVRFDEVVELLGKARFAPVIHRPLFRHLGLVTNRTFETFYADAIPVLMLPRDFVASIYGEAGLALVPGPGLGGAPGRCTHAPGVLLGCGAAGSRPSRAPPLLCATPRRTGVFACNRATPWSGGVNILFVMKHRGNAGNTHAVANYQRVAPHHGHSVAIYGTPIWYVPELQFSTDIKDFDRVVYVFESDPYRIKTLHEAVMLTHFPRSKRLILDSDGMYNPVVNIDGYDFNHRNEAEREWWIAYFDAIGDHVMQTTVAKPTNPRVSAMTFYGYNEALQVDPASARRSSTTSCTWAITGGAGGRCRPSCCRPSRRSATRSARSASSGCGGMRRRPRDPRRGRRRPSTPTRRRCGGCGSR